MSENIAFEREKWLADIELRKRELDIREREQQRNLEDIAFEREQWLADIGFREKDLSIRERTQANQDSELALKEKEHQASAWRNPLTVAIFAAAVAAAGNAVVAVVNGSLQRDLDNNKRNSELNLERSKAESLRILEMIKTGNPDKAAENLSFLLKSGLISDEELSKKLQIFLSSRTPGTGPSLPSLAPAKDATELLTKFEGVLLKPQKDPLGRLIIGSGHLITDEEIASGLIIIEGIPVGYANGITPEQAQKLANQDLEPWRNQIKALVSAPLNQNQIEALSSLAYNFGIEKIRKSQIPTLINAGKYDAVPMEIMTFSKIRGKEWPGLLKRRQEEAALWNKK